MYCTKCGKELEQKYKFCPECGGEIDNSGDADCTANLDLQENVETNQNAQSQYEVPEIRKYQLHGARITIVGNRLCRLIDIPSTINVQREHIQVTTKGGTTEFNKDNINKIDFKTRPLWRLGDIVAIILFIILTPFLMFGVPLYCIIGLVYFACSRNLVLVLNSGKKVVIPIRQDSDAIPFLQELGYQNKTIQVLENKRIDDKKWEKKKYIKGIVFFISILILAAINSQVMMY